ncbi:unnamed protein product [Anisakis simplex]|uniref:VWFA domain-containing protein n=1 Tax=Anisakis simplex TaxID=6269 RepID=A0A0M3KH36_ANISI|nr:unnamed protein product [Anisakis simplex]
MSFSECVNSYNEGKNSEKVLLVSRKLGKNRNDDLILHAKAGECKKTPVDVLFLVDITTDNNKVFEAQQKKIVETIRHLSGSGFVSDARFGIIVFNQRPLLLVPLTSPRAKILERVIFTICLKISITSYLIDGFFAFEMN